MERNTLLAIALSAAVFFLYQAIFVPPKHPALPTNSQAIVNQSVVDNKSKPSETSLNLEVKSTNSSNIENYYDFKNHNFDLEFYNVGGSLHNIDFYYKATNFLPTTGSHLGHYQQNLFPITDLLSIDNFENVPYEGQKIDNKRMDFIYQDKNWQIRKTFTIEDNLIKARMEVKNLSEISNLDKFNIKAFDIDLSRLEINQIGREGALFEYSIYANNRMFRKGNATKFDDKNDRNETANVDWIGFRNHYFALIVKPEFETKGYEIKSDGNKQLKIFIKPLDKSLAPQESATYDFTIYAGPQNPWLMKSYNKGFEKIVAFSNFPIIEWIAQAIYHIIPFFHTIFRSWGVAIILMSLIIYGITYPLTMKSMMSMRKMQEIQPKITALRERYKNDAQKLHMETMEIYRREKINPLGGCLPVLIQMPFFMALYQVLWRAQYFEGHSFLWIKDLSQPDRLIIFPFYLPLIGNELNILPILTGCLMFLQQQISSKNMVVVDEQQAAQQKMMKYILPIMMTFMFYKFASSWAIYFLVFYSLSTITQWKISKLSAKK